MSTDFTSDRIIPLWSGTTPGTEAWQQEEKISWTPPESMFRFRFARNVTVPTLTTFLPEKPNGSAVIICPGGAMHILAVDHEGYDVASWLQARGIAAFVLKYRVLPTPANDDEYEAYMQQTISDSATMRRLTQQLHPYMLADGQRAIAIVRQRARAWNLNPQHIGIMGFSAGGTVAANVALYHQADSRPNFAACIYPALWETPVLPQHPPPLFLALANNDEFGAIMFDSSTRLLEAWRNAQQPVELHAYAKGGHGFGMLKKGLPSDAWIERFHEWLIAL